METGQAGTNSTTSGGALPRRQFVAMSVVGAFTLAIASAGRIVLEFLKPQPKDGDFGGLFDAGVLSDFPPGSVTPVRAGRFFLVHGNDGLLALHQRCTHLGCLVPWDEAQGRFACPCHAGQYSRVGEVLAGPPPRPLDLFEVRVDGQRVIVDTGRAIERERYEPSQATRV